MSTEFEEEDSPNDLKITNHRVKELRSTFEGTPRRVTLEGVSGDLIP